MAKTHFIKWLEYQAQQLRDKCQLTPFARLDPFTLANKMDVIVLNPAEIVGISEDILEQVLVNDPDSWDAGTVSLGEGRHIVVLNPRPCRERQNASLMEELAHVFLGHKPCRLHSINGIVLREWKQSQETQAYFVGAAALVPQRVVKGAITRRMTVSALAAQCGVSTKLIEFRERILGLRLARPAVAS